jgi:hypothetical protein
MRVRADLFFLSITFISSDLERIAHDFLDRHCCHA